MTLSQLCMIIGIIEDRRVVVTAQEENTLVDQDVQGRIYYNAWLLYINLNFNDLTFVHS